MRIAVFKLLQKIKLDSWVFIQKRVFVFALVKQSALYQTLGATKL